MSEDVTTVCTMPTTTTPEQDTLEQDTPEAGAPHKRTRRRIKSPSRARHPFLAGRPAGVWYADAVGVVPNYPKTQAAYDRSANTLRANRAKAIAAGTLTRLGVPDGWAGRKDEARAARAEAKQSAKTLVGQMIELRHWEPDNEEAQVCMEHAIAIALSPTIPVETRLNAMRLILTYTQAAPVARQHIMAADPLGYLRELADRAKDEDDKSAAN